MTGDIVLELAPRVTVTIPAAVWYQLDDEGRRALIREASRRAFKLWLRPRPRPRVEPA